MSEVRTRARVQSVSSAVLTAVATGTVIAAGALIKGVLSALSVSVAHLVQDRGLPRTITSGDPVAAAPVMAAAPTYLPPVERAKISALLRTAGRGFIIEDRGGVEAALAGLRQAQTLNQVQAAERILTATLKSEHQKVFVRALSRACENACQKTGFSDIQTMSRGPGMTRVIASDSTGRALVSEITAEAGKQPRLVTEVVGVADGSCHAILDAFDKALEAEGVRAAPPEWKATGGVCELAATREFVQRRLYKPVVSRRGGSSSREPEQRARRVEQLNRPAKGIQEQLG